MSISATSFVERTGAASTDSSASASTEFRSDRPIANAIVPVAHTLKSGKWSFNRNPPENRMEEWCCRQNKRTSYLLPYKWYLNELYDSQASQFSTIKVGSMTL